MLVRGVSHLVKRAGALVQFIRRGYDDACEPAGTIIDVRRRHMAGDDHVAMRLVAVVVRGTCRLGRRRVMMPMRAIMMCMLRL